MINIPAGGRALLRISDLNVTEITPSRTLGIPMTVIGWNARLLRDQDGNNLAYQTNSITLGGGESADVILDACQGAPPTARARRPATRRGRSSTSTRRSSTTCRTTPRTSAE